MIRFDLKPVVASHLIDHSLQGMVADLLGEAASPADQVVVRRRLGDLVPRFRATGIGGHHDAEIDEKAECPVERRTLDRRIELVNAGIDITQGSVPAPRANRIEDNRPLACYPMPRSGEDDLPLKLVMRHDPALPATFGNNVRAIWLISTLGPGW